MFRIAHISDPHLGPLPAFARGDLGLKQRIGHLNWNRNRAGAQDEAVLDAILADIRAARPNHITVTGDLINLGLEAEVEGARRWLEGLGPPEAVSVVPGNHDSYTRGSDTYIRSHWASHMRGEETDNVAGARFPYLRRRGDVALIGVSTALPTAPLMATGRIGRKQLAALAALLRTANQENLCRVIMIHHPPDNGACPWHKRLLDADAFRQVISAWGAELILCGHNHRNRRATIEGPSGEVPVIGVAATSMLPSSDRAGGTWNLVECARTHDHFKLSVTARSWSLAGKMVDIGRFDLGS